jgi:hypothetical protein
MYILGSTVDLNDSEVYANNGGTGGGVYIKSGTNVGKLTLNDTKVFDNTASRGGGVAIYGGSTVTCESSVGDFGLYGNTATSTGGAAYIFEGSFTSNGCDFGDAAGTLLPNSPDTVFSADAAEAYTFENNASFDCDHIACES